jgi:hypothetical protein
MVKIKIIQEIDWDAEDFEKHLKTIELAGCLRKYLRVPGRFFEKSRGWGTGQMLVYRKCFDVKYPLMQLTLQYTTLQVAQTRSLRVTVK